MNKSLYIIIALIVVVGGLIGYTLFGRPSPVIHTAGDGHTDTQHAESIPHDDTGKTQHDNSVTPSHGNSGLAPHND